MNPWRDILKALQAELDRLSQEIEGVAVVPNGIQAALPASRFEKWTPILEAVTAELGEELVEWVAGSRRAWYGGRGPFLTLRLEAERGQPEITCEFLSSDPEAAGSTREEPAGGKVAGDSAAEPPEPEEAPARRAPVADRAGLDAGLSRPLADGTAGVEAEVEAGDRHDEASDDGGLHLSRIELD